MSETAKHSEMSCDSETGLVTKSRKRGKGIRRRRGQQLALEEEVEDFFLEFCIFDYPPLKLRGRLKVPQYFI